MHHPKTDEAYEKLLDNAGDALVVVKFSADWCGPCKKITPEVKKLAVANPDVVFIDFDVDLLIDHPHGDNVRGLPTFKLYRDGVLLTAFAGANIAALKNKISEYS